MSYKRSPTERFVRQLLQSGSTYKEVAEMIGCTRQNVGNIVKVKSPKPSACQRCGSKKRVQAHHVNYVTDEHEWLCDLCHKREHCFPKSKKLTRFKNPHAVALGRKGGKVRSAAKARASRRNGAMRGKMGKK